SGATPSPGPASSPSARGYGSAAQADIAAQAKAGSGGKPEAPAPKGDQPKDAPAKGDRSEPAPVGQATRAAPAKAAPAPTPGSDERVKASPYVRKLAREHDLDLHGVSGSGPAGRVVARDVTTLLEGGAAGASEAAPADPGQATRPPAAEAKPAGKPATDAGKADAGKTGGKPAARPAPGGLAEPEERPLSMMRKTIARRLTEAKQTVPHFYLTIDVDAGALVALREQVNGELAQAVRPGDEAAKVSLNDLLIKACAVALRRVPECNAQFTPEAILVHRRVDISVAVAVPEGLVTPVLRDADRLGLTAIGSAVRDLATRAKAKKLAPEEMQNGTFSISNLGMFGIDEFAAVINPPEGAILAVGRVRDEPVVRDGAVVAGKRLALTLSCDHRVIDGAVGARFLDALRGLIERPMQILVG
ncbi:MAG: 2-oxo acid dehydrogenase subunit E2, partial [Myxococcales bacterium]